MGRSQELGVRSQGSGIRKPSQADPLAEISWREVCTALDEELARLPDRCRAPLVLCYLESKTQDEALQQLGWSKSTFRRRLEEGRKRLCSRLTRRGITLSAGLWATLLSDQGASAALPIALSQGTVEAATAFAAGKIAGAALSPQVSLLTKEGLKAAVMYKMKWVALAGIVTALATGMGLAAHQALKASQTTVAPKESVALADERRDQPKPEKANQARVDRYGDPLPEGATARLGTVRYRVPNTTVAFCQTGKTFVSLLQNAVLVFDAATGKIIHQFATSSRIHSVAISPDGETVAAGEDHGIRIWDVPRHRELRLLSAPNSYPQALRFRPDGKALAVASVNEPFRLWDVATGKELWKRTDNHPFRLEPVAFFPDGKTLVALEGDGGGIVFLDTATGEERRRLKGPGRDPVFSADLKMFATGANDWAIHLWDATTGKELRKIAGMRGRPELVAFSPDGKVLAWSRGDGGISLVEVATGREQRRIAKSLGSVYLLTFWPNDKTLAFRTWFERTVRFWDNEHDREIRPSEGHRGDIAAFVYSADGKNLISASMDGTIRYWNPATGKELHQFTAHQGGAWCLALAPDGKTLATGSANGQPIRLWDGPLGKEVGRLEQPANGVVSLAFSPDGKILASGGSSPAKEDRFLCLWDVSTGKELPQFAGKPYPASVGVSPVDEMMEGIVTVSHVAFSPDGKLLASAKQNTIHVWNIATGRQYRQFTVPRMIKSMAFSPDGKSLVCGFHGDGKGSLRLWEIASGKEQLSIKTMSAKSDCLAFSADGRLLAVGGSDSKITDQLVIRVLDVRNGEVLREFPGHQCWLTSLAFSPDGKRLASGSWDTTILIWDVGDLLPAGQGSASNESGQELDSLWGELAAEDAEKAYQAIWKLVALPEQSLPLLKERLKPAAPIDPGRLAQLIADLDNKSFNVREKASDELGRLEELAEPALRTALEGQRSPETRRRVERLLERLERPAGEELRSLRAVEVFEHIGNAGARAMLESLAGGAARARLTQEARASLERLSKRSGTPP